MPVRAGFLLLALLVLAAPAGAREARTVKLAFPRFTVPASTSVEACRFVHLPTTAPFDLASWEIRMRGAGNGFTTLHFLVYVYTGERLAEFATETGRVVPSRGCLELGPPDRDRRQLFALGALPTNRGAFPPGVALRLAPVPATPGGPPDGIGILLDANWSNGLARPRTASAKVVLRRARPGTVRRLALPLASEAAEAALVVAPGTVGSTEASTAAFNAARFGDPPLRDEWRPSADACLVSLTGRMHRRGRFLGVDLLDATGGPANPPGGATNPFEPARRHLFGVSDYTDPGLLNFARPQLVRAGEAVHYGCWTDNGLTTPLRLGCEETSGAPPGTPLAAGGAPAKPCRVGGANPLECPASDPNYPGRAFTGACVVANAVAGVASDDEACALTGTYFEAAPDGGCDVSGLPAL